MQVSKAALTAVRLQDNGRMMAVAAADGSTSVLRVSAGLTDIQPNEKSVFSSVRRTGLVTESLPPVQTTLGHFKDLRTDTRKVAHAGVAL